MLTQIQLIKPDDWHIHLRDGEYLDTTVPHCCQRFARAIIMPNLSPPVYTVDEALAYRQRILQAVPADHTFQPLMTLYLTDNTETSEIKKAYTNDHIFAIKLYPAGATTGAQHGVTDIQRLYPVFDIMEEFGLPLLIHGEDVDPETDVFDRERRFIDTQLTKLCDKFKNLKIVMEHISTQEAVHFIQNASSNVAATITAHHLWINRNAMFQTGIQPHHYCLPVAKREHHRQALLAAATSGNPKFFLGTDSAPHAKSDKESACGCAGIYTAHAAVELYAEIFAGQGALEKLEAFASLHGPAFYNLPENNETITLRKHTWQIPDHYELGHQQLVPFMANKSISWQIQNSP